MPACRFFHSLAFICNILSVNANACDAHKATQLSTRRCKYYVWIGYTRGCVFVCIEMITKTQLRYNSMLNIHRTYVKFLGASNFSAYLNYGCAYQTSMHEMVLGSRAEDPASPSKVAKQNDWNGMMWPPPHNTGVHTAQSCAYGCGILHYVYAITK